ncbi:hypothetical protein HK099_007034 [Clydaea vesicula]|uniref:Uncharacterized protein n=1 Tax=Clydaea vesicula TaxID=447962 RepID=A0AAD5XY09_9FUNG|nr:hypothetical protein HK099_007034 [Clydaea vesicula]
MFSTKVNNSGNKRSKLKIFIFGSITLGISFIIARLYNKRHENLLELPETVLVHLKNLKNKESDELHYLNALEEVDAVLGDSSVERFKLVHQFYYFYLIHKKYDDAIKLLFLNWLKLLKIQNAEINNLHLVTSRYKDSVAQAKIESVSNSILKNSNSFIGMEKKETEVKSTYLDVINKLGYFNSFSCNLATTFWKINNIDAATLILEWNLRYLLGYPSNVLTLIERIESTFGDNKILNSEKLESINLLKSKNAFEKYLKKRNLNFFGYTKELQEKNLENFNTFRNKHFQYFFEHAPNFDVLISEERITALKNYFSEIRSKVKKEEDNFKVKDMLSRKDNLYKALRSEFIQYNFLPEKLNPIFKHFSVDFTNALNLVLHIKYLYDNLEDDCVLNVISIGQDLLQNDRVRFEEEREVQFLNNSKMNLKNEDKVYINKSNTSESNLRLLKSQILLNKCDFENALINLNEDLKFLNSLKVDDSAAKYLFSRKEYFSLIYLGVIYLAKGDKEKSLECFKKAKSITSTLNDLSLHKRCEGYIQDITNLPP